LAGVVKTQQDQNQNSRFQGRDPDQYFDSYDHDKDSEIEFQDIRLECQEDMQLLHACLMIPVLRLWHCVVL